MKLSSSKWRGWLSTLVIGSVTPEESNYFLARDASIGVGQTARGFTHRRKQNETLASEDAIMMLRFYSFMARLFYDIGDWFGDRAESVDPEFHDILREALKEPAHRVITEDDIRYTRKWLFGDDE